MNRSLKPRFRGRGIRGQLVVSIRRDGIKNRRLWRPSTTVLLGCLPRETTNLYLVACARVLYGLVEDLLMVEA